MMTGNLLLIMYVSLFSFGQKELPHYRLRFDHFNVLHKIPEPSDIVFDKDSNHYFIVSDHGRLFECDLEGNVIRKAIDEGLDFEGVEVKDSFVYVSDETPRKVYQYRKGDLSLVKVYSLAWGGAMNKAYESITYNYTKKCFVLVAQQPATIVEYTDDFMEISRTPFPGARDISGARWHDGKIYLLADLDASIIMCNASTYKQEAYYKINVLNPEGIAFDANGNVSITSDDLQRLYFFKSLPTIN